MHVSPVSALPPATYWQQFRRTLLATQAICLVIVLLLSAMGMQWRTALTYSLAIGNLNSLLIHLGRFGLARWMMRGQQATAAQHEGWPGWPGMAAVILLSVAIAYPLGSLIAEWVLGIDHPWTGSHLWNEWRAPLVISLLAVVSGTYFFYSRARLADAELALAQIGRQAAETQLKLLHSQLEPHMLFNTLANLRALIAVDPPRAQAMLDRIIDFLRATLDASRSSQHSLREEFARVADYLALMQVRMGDRLKIELDLPAELSLAQVPPLVLQPLVENAIKHGLEPQRGGGSLRVRAEPWGVNGLRLIVADSGVGLTTVAATDTPNRAGFGLTQVRERLATLYGPRASFLLEPAPGGGSVATVELPLVFSTTPPSPEEPAAEGVST